MKKKRERGRKMEKVVLSQLAIRSLFFQKVKRVIECESREREREREK